MTSADDSASETVQRLTLDVELKNRKIEELSRDLSRANATIDILQQRLNDVLTSTTWRMTGFQRQMLQRLPPGLRAYIRAHLVSVYRVLKKHLSRPILPVTASHSRDSVGIELAVWNATNTDNEYEFWVREYDTISDGDRQKIRDRIKDLTVKPLISVVVPVYETPEPILRQTIESVRSQLYSNWELCLADDASKAPHIRAVLDEYAAKDKRIKRVYRKTNGHISAASNSALALASGEYVALLDHDDILPEHALYMVTAAIAKAPTADIFYSDEDKLDAHGNRCDPAFKPDWNQELLFGQNYLNHLTVYKRAILDQIGGFRVGYEGSQDYDLALRAIAATKGPIVHIPHILYHWRIFSGAETMSSSDMNRALLAARRALTEHFAGLGHSVTVDDVLGHFHRVIRPDPATWPKISVIIPTRDHADVLEVVVQGLIEKTDYPNLEIIIADNDSVEPETLAYFETCRTAGVKILPCPGAFNYSAINNQAVAQSSGELVLLLNNDISMIEPYWLKEMARYFSDSTIGAVGAKLLYPDGMLQHAGVVLGLGGVAGHRYVNYPRHETGRFGQLALAHDISCVTGACLLIRRSVFDAVGGLDAENLRVAFNDVDLCIRVREAGHRIIWTPHAELYHHESRSRGLDVTGEKLIRFRNEVAFMLEKWGDTLRTDPHFNPNLSIETTNPGFAYPPRQERI